MANGALFHSKTCFDHLQIVLHITVELTVPWVKSLLILRSLLWMLISSQLLLSIKNNKWISFLETLSFYFVTDKFLTPMCRSIRIFLTPGVWQLFKIFSRALKRWKCNFVGNIPNGNRQDDSIRFKAHCIRDYFYNKLVTDDKIWVLIFWWNRQLRNLNPLLPRILFKYWNTWAKIRMLISFWLSFIFKEKYKCIGV